MENLKDHMERHMRAAPELVVQPNVVPIRTVREQKRSSSDLVSQLADMIRAKEDRASRVEAQALGVARSAIEQLASAERLARASDEARRSAEARVQVAESTAMRLDERNKSLEKMLLGLQSTVHALHAQLSEARTRADANEETAREAKAALFVIEDALRTRLLGGGSAQRNGPLAASG